MKTYEGKRVEGRPLVTVNDGEKIIPLIPFFHEGLDFDKSKFDWRFDWGCEHFGSLQLAVSVLNDFLGDSEKANDLSFDFRSKIIAKLDSNKNWILTGEDIEKALPGKHA